MIRRAVCVTSCVASMVVGLCATSVGAQAKPPTMLTGFVRDSAGSAVPNARVQVADHKQRATTDQNGRFSIGGLPVADTLHVIVARIGFRPVHLELALVEGANDITVELEPIAHQLDAMRTEVEQAGLFGVVGDTAYAVIAGAHVSLIVGAGVQRETNELGQFAIDSVKPGANMLDVRKAGFAPRLLSFMHPPKGGTRVAIWMRPLPPGWRARDSELPNFVEQALFDFRLRTRWKANDAAIITRELLTRYGTGMRLSDAIDRMPGQLTKGARARDFTVEVDGKALPDVFTLADFNADDVEMVELFPPGTNFTALRAEQRRMRRTNPVTSISAARGAGAGTQPQVVRVGEAHIWLRR